MDKLRLYDFIRLDMLARFQLVRAEGQLLYIIREEEYLLMLHNLSDFYVEMRYHELKNQIEDITPFRKTRKLSQYLEQIDPGKLLAA
jgi:hypothetical protein